MKINIKRISEITGFSPATVSNALNKKRGVNQQTAEQILKVAKEYGYVSETRIKSVRIVTYRDSGEVFYDAPFFTTLLDSVENESRQHGFETKLVNLYRNDANYEQQVAELLADNSSAILLVGTELNEADAKPFLTATMPLVLIDCAFPELPFHAVLMDNRNSVQMAIKHLVNQGHTKIGYLHANIDTQNFQRRYTGFKQAMNYFHLTPEPEFIFELPVSIQGAHEAFSQLLAKGIDLPTAFFADNDMIALGVMQALQQHNYRIPEDISLIGFDDINLSQVFTPGLTTIKVQKKELGQMAIHKLLALIENPDLPRSRTELYNELIVRNSVTKPKS